MPPIQGRALLHVKSSSLVLASREKLVAREVISLLAPVCGHGAGFILHLFLLFCT